MAAKGSDYASDEIIDKKCSACAGKNIMREAEKYCIECQDYYCIPCTDLHKTFPAMRGHNLLEKANFSKRRIPSSLPCSPTERCQMHKTKLLDMFCNDHDEVVCATCVAIKHRACQDIYSIPDEIDNLFNQSACDEIKQQLTAETINAEYVKKEKQQFLQELKKQRETAIKSIVKYRKELEAELMRLEEESIKQIDEKCNSIDKECQSEIKETEKHIEVLEQSTDKLQKSDDNKAQAFVIAKTARKTILTASHFRGSLKTMTHVEINFSANMEVKDILQEFNELGLIHFEHVAFKPKNTAYEVKQQKGIDVKIETDDKPCLIYGSCFTEDGYCVLADYNNSELKCVDMSKETIKDHLSLEAGPIAACLTGKHEAAVSMNNKTIQFVSLGNKMTTTRKLRMNHHCYGLACDNEKLYISDEENSVYVHDLNGTLLRIITTDRSGKQIFSSTRHISLSTERDWLYVADCHKGVITLDLSGNYLSTFTDSDLVDPWGICTDERGNVFVSGLRSSNIVQISEKTNTKLCTIKTVSNPLTVSFDPYKNQLVTTHYSRNSITVHELH